MTKEEFELKVSVIISATNTSGNEKLDAIMKLCYHNDVLKSLLKIWGQVEYDYEDKNKTIREETMKALKQFGFQFN